MKNGDLSQVAVDTPAFEYNSNGTYKGLLVENASENLCLQSEDITTTWTAANATITANDTTAPDGNTTADKLNDDSGGGTSVVLIEQAITVVAGTKYTASVFLKADQLAFAALRVHDYDGATGGSQFFELSGAGSLGTASNLDDSRIEVYPNGWYRCSITWTQGAADTSFVFRIYLADSISSNVVNLDGTSSIYVWGAQVEESYPSSYIPTTTTSVTRSIDIIEKTSASTYIGQTAGTIYAEVDVLNFTGISQYILRAQESTTPIENGIFLGISPGGTFMFRLDADDGATDIDFSSAATTGTHKLALVYESGDVRAYLDGSQVGSSTSAWTFGDTVEDISIGTTFDNWIRAFAFYKRALSDNEAKILTQ